MLLLKCEVNIAQIILALVKLCISYAINVCADCLMPFAMSVSGNFAIRYGDPHVHNSVNGKPTKNHAGAQ